MRFIQIIYKEERWKTYGVAVYVRYSIFLWDRIFLLSK